jgi:hypothetical protein
MLAATESTYPLLDLPQIHRFGLHPVDLRICTADLRAGGSLLLDLLL